jgi:hypothetical protein
MSIDRIDHLIEAAQNGVRNECDFKAICEWKQETIDYLIKNLGPDHYYTEFFSNYLKEVEQKSLFTGGGVLSAVREEISRRDDNY